MEQPLVSVIVPVFNAGKYLSQCVESVLGQTFTRWELLLVDDGSTDGSTEACDAYALRDSRIRVWHKGNGGASSARNVGLDKARGEWIAFLDADDYLLPHSLKALVEEALRSGADLIAGKALSLNNGTLKPKPEPPVARGNKVMSSVPRPEIWGYLFRRELIERHSLRFREGLRFAEDWLFCFEYASWAGSVRRVDTPVYVYRTHPSSAVNSADNAEMAPHLLAAACHLHQLASTYSTEDKRRRKAALDMRDNRLRLWLCCEMSGTVTRETLRASLSRCRALFDSDREHVAFLCSSLPLCFLKARLQRLPRLRRALKRMLRRE
ncbi:MAG: glycosyltransferase [Prevotellaceae bacterium]|nr:glycosyltransferase [Prevotellaceae bacterium]